MKITKLSPEQFHRLTPEQFRVASKLPLTVVLDNLRSGYNTGAIFRLADAFRIKELILCGTTPHPPHREVRKTALGADQVVAWHYFPSAEDLLPTLRENHSHIVVLEHTTASIPLHRWHPPDVPLAIVVGNEVSGVSDTILQLAHTIIEIPQWGTKHSLNVATATAIILWHYILHSKQAKLLLLKETKCL